MRQNSRGVFPKTLLQRSRGQMLLSVEEVSPRAEKYYSPRLGTEEFVCRGVSLEGRSLTSNLTWGRQAARHTCTTKTPTAAGGEQDLRDVSSVKGGHARAQDLCNPRNRCSTPPFARVTPPDCMGLLRGWISAPCLLKGDLLLYGT